MTRCTQALNSAELFVLGNCEMTAFDDYLCYYHRKLADGLCRPEFPAAYKNPTDKAA